MSSIRDIVMTFGFGALVGAIFGVFSQPIPAPPTLAGAAGVIGVTAGFIIMQAIK